MLHHIEQLATEMSYHLGRARRRLRRDRGKEDQPADQNEPAGGEPLHWRLSAAWHASSPFARIEV
jgi:hypothetical protein